MNINQNVYSNITLSNNQVLKSTSNLLKADRSVKSLRPEGYLPEVEFRGLPPELELYNEKKGMYSTGLQSTYVNEKGEFQGGTLQNVYDKYQTFYDEIENSDLSDKDKEISMYALDDAFKQHSDFYSTLLIGGMSRGKEPHIRRTEPGSPERMKLTKHFYNQSKAIYKSINELSKKLMDYVKGNLNKTGMTASEYLNGSFSNNTNTNSTISNNMTLNQIQDLEKSVSSGTYDYLDNYSNEESTENIQSSKDYEDEKRELTFGTSGYSGYKKIVEKYNLEPQVRNLEVN